MTRKARVAIEDLSYCGGCEIALADLGQELLDLFDRKIELVYAPLLMSATDYGQVDVLFLTGAARNAGDIEHLQWARENARYLVALGSCAAFGGVPGLGNFFAKDQLLRAAFEQAPSLAGSSAAPGTQIPALTEDVRPIDAHVKVDFVLAGCPPPPPVMAQFLSALLKKIRIEPIKEQEHLER